MAAIHPSSASTNGFCIRCVTFCFGGLAAKTMGMAHPSFPVPFLRELGARFCSHWKTWFIVLHSLSIHVYIFLGWEIIRSCHTAIPRGMDHVGAHYKHCLNHQCLPPNHVDAPHIHHPRIQVSWILRTTPASAIRLVVDPVRPLSHHWTRRTTVAREEDNAVVTKTKKRWSQQWMQIYAHSKIEDLLINSVHKWGKNAREANTSSCAHVHSISLQKTQYLKRHGNDLLNISLQKQIWGPVHIYVSVCVQQNRT